MYIKSTTPIIIITMLIILVGGCTDNDTETLKGADDSGSKSTESYDSRFPFKVWTDKGGIMHFDVNFGEGASYPSEDVVLGNLAGNGWEVDKCYTYDVKTTLAPGKWTYALNEYDGAIMYVTGGDMSPRFFFKDKTSAVEYFKWWYLPGENGDLQDTDTHYSQKDLKYSYDAKTGTLNCSILGWFHVIESTDNELWLGRGENKEPYEYNFVRLVKATPETVAEWEKKYIEPEKAPK